MAGLKRSDFLTSEEGREIKQKFQQMAASNSYNTTSSYNANSTLYPGNQISFVDKHMNYLINHPKVEPQKYLANIQLMSRVR